MSNTVKSRNRLHDLYEESPEDGAHDYVQLRRRMLELSLASARAMRIGHRTWSIVTAMAFLSA